MYVLFYCYFIVLKLFCARRHKKTVTIISVARLGGFLLLFI